MRSSRSRQTAKPLLEPAQVAALYELHSQNSTAVNEALLELAGACSCANLAPRWVEALRLNRLSMWLQQVLAFEDALGLFVHRTKDAFRRARRPRTRPASASPPNWVSRSAYRAYSDMVRLGAWLGLGSDQQFELECQVAPRHFVWRDAWAHHGGRLRDCSAEVFSYSEKACALEEVQGIAYPLDNAWREARGSFSRSIDLLLAASGRI